MEIAKLGLVGSREGKTGLTHPALPSFMAYISAVFLASFCMPLPNSSSSMARFLKNTDASCRREGVGERERMLSAMRRLHAGANVPYMISCSV